MAPHFLAELVALVVASAAVAYVGQRFLKLVPLVGFLLAGVAIGPHALGLVHDLELVEGAAEIGVILLLFTIGIEFSLERLARIRRLILVGGGLQVTLTVLLVTGLLVAAGVAWRPAVFTGCLVALSSTVIVLKLLADRGRTGSEPGQAALAILLFQDLVVVGMVLLVPALAGTAAGGSGVAAALAKAAVIVVVVLVVARRVMPPFLERVARTCSPDIFLLTVVAVGLGTAWLSSLAGLSVSLGAFLAGLVVSESRLSEHAFSELLPLRVLFSAVFFMSVGMLLDPRFVLEHPLLVAAAVAGVLVVKLAATGAGLLAMGRPAGMVAASALLLAQVGEFSFVLERTGRDAGLFPAGSEALGGQTFIAATVVLMIATPFWSELAWRVERRGTTARGAGRGTTASPAAAEDADAAGTPHVIIAGYGAHARGLVRALADAAVPYRIVTLSPDGAAEAAAEGRPVLMGDYTRQPILEHAGIATAGTFVVADDDAAMAERAVAVARVLGPELRIVVRTARAADVHDLRRAGADAVITDETAATERLQQIVLSHDPGGTMNEPAPLVALRPGAADAGCAHVDGLEPVLPRARGCEECLASGDTWVHLRVCMTCGHVGCCDSSVNRHATRHHRETEHPVVRSLEAGEDWGWCYVDRVML